jgi:hypothetical protein
VLVEQSRSMTQVAEHVLFDLPGVLFRRSLEDVQRHHVRKFDLVMASHTLSELCSDRERQEAVSAGGRTGVGDGWVSTV